MPKLSKFAVPEVKLDAGAAALEASLTTEQRRGLFEQPGMVVVAIVELTSKSYTGHADGEDKDPQVKLRVTGCEVARTDDEAAALLEAKRAMYRKRKVDGTFDEVGPGSMDVDAVISEAFATYPSEAEYQAHQDAQQRVHR